MLKSFLANIQVRQSKVSSCRPVMPHTIKPSQKDRILVTYKYIRYYYYYYYYY